VLFLPNEKKDGTIVAAGSQTRAMAITADGDTGETIKRVYGYFSNDGTRDFHKYLLTGGLDCHAGCSCLTYNY
jgi:hypothetical protein